jgi:hypothetical protein
MGEKWSPRRLILIKQQKEREREREKQHHPLTHQEGIRFFLTPPKSKFVPLNTTIHLPSVNMRQGTWRKRESKVCLGGCVFYSFLQTQIQPIHKAVLSYTYPTGYNPSFSHSLFFIFYFLFFFLSFFFMGVIVRGGSEAISFALNVGFRSLLSSQFQPHL